LFEALQEYDIGAEAFYCGVGLLTAEAKGPLVTRERVLY